AVVQLTRIEYRLLAVLARHAGRVLTHEFLLREVWGPSYTSQSHYLRVYMAQLRHKLEPDPGRPRLLMTETGVGYRMSESSTKPSKTHETIQLGDGPMRRRRSDWSRLC